MEERFKVEKGFMSRYDVIIEHEGIKYPLASFHNIDLPGYKQDAKTEAQVLCEHLNKDD